MKLNNAKTDRINLTFLVVFGAFLVPIGLMTKTGFYGMGLVCLLLSLSYTRYRAYTRYIVPTLLIIGATIFILGWCFIPTLQQIPPLANPYVSSRVLVSVTGMGVFCSGIANLVVTRIREKRRP